MAWLLMILTQGEPLFEEAWKRFPAGTTATYAVERSEGGKASTWTETITLKETGDHVYPSLSDSRAPGDAIAFMVGRTTLSTLLKTFAEESREKTDLTVDGKPITCTLTVFGNGRRRASVWASAETRAQLRPGPLTTSLPPQVLKVEVVETAGERVDTTRHTVTGLAKKATLNGRDLLCTIENVLVERKGSSEDFVTKTHLYYCAELPGGLLSEVRVQTTADGRTATLTRRLSRFQVPP